MINNDYFSFVENSNLHLCQSGNYCNGDLKTHFNSGNGEVKTYLKYCNGDIKTYSIVELWILENI